MCLHRWTVFLFLGACVFGAERESADQTELKRACTEFFTASTNAQANWKFSERLDQLLRDDEPAVRRAAWEAFRAAPIHDALKKDFETNQVRFEKHLSPYTIKTVGTRPTNGWALFIAMHGGGGGPKQINDSQWTIMQRYYRDHPEVGGYCYVALRAPNDTWNGFYDVYVYPLVANLIRQFLLFADVDPNKVFIMGYSHGGYGAFAIGPKMPDRFAAIHASAAAPTDGETTAKTLRNTAFTYMIGEKDTMYGRIERCRKFDDTIQKLRADHSNAYPVVMQYIAGHGHGGLPDRDKIIEMYPHTRNPAHAELTWLMTDKVITDFYWLRVSTPGKKKEIEAICHNNRITLTATTNITDMTLLLDSRLVNFNEPVVVEVNGATSSHRLQPSLRTLCATLLRRGDPELAFTTELAVPVPVASAKAAPSSTPQAEWKFPCPEEQIASYTAFHTSEPIVIDGRLEESAWQHAPRSPRFVDIISGKPALYDTRATLLWDESNLYIAFRAEEPLVRAKFTTNNSPIYYDNDVEVFIAGRDAYYEFEVNALNTTYEAFFIWNDAYETGGFAGGIGFDRSALKPFNGVGFKTHPRGPRLGAFDWSFPGKKTAVWIDGTLNKDDDRDRAWTVELAFPWKGMAWLARADQRALPPHDGDVWRIDFSRFNQYKEAPPAKDSGGWVWSRHGIWDSHIPECFPRIRFSTNNVFSGK